MKNVFTVILAGGAGERLHPLTRNRAKPAVPFGGVYRIIDFTIANCINSLCRRIHILTQYKSQSLSRHVRFAWNITRPELGEFIDIVPPQMRVNDSWYRGTADAIYHNFYSIDRESPREVLILSGDHIYKMDYQKMVQFHRQTEAAVTVATMPVPLHEAGRYGIVEVDAGGRMMGFEEKPTNPRPDCNDPGLALASMGIYLFNIEVLRKAILADAAMNTSHDFGRDILPRLIDSVGIYAYPFQDENKKESPYWRDVGTLDSFWEANMDLVEVDPQFNLYDTSWPLQLTLPPHPPAKFVFAEPGGRYGAATDSVIGPGCIISGGQVWRSVLSPRVRVNSYANVEESVLFSGVDVGRSARLKKVIIEKNVHIPEHAEIGYDLEQDAKHFRVTPSGVVVVESTDIVPISAIVRN
ncbi:MAG: glucose-1-phosphate adenylyltransferase [Candidatus Hydrogenedentes bacterium]|nr:glucose-1-phosphate adenylyltransferase [Candidatus Hydrogenedentota bacterium]